MSAERRQAFERARRTVAVAMRVVAAALGALLADAGTRRSVLTGTRPGRRVALRDTSLAKAALAPRGCEDLH